LVLSLFFYLTNIEILAKKLFLDKVSQNDINEVVEKALIYMKANYWNSNLTIKTISDNCNVSEIYLRKLFEKHLKNTPFRELTKVRMNRAKLMIEEKRPLLEVALSVGYSDIYQFSRAYKKYFGVCKEKKC
jgi:iron complex transport system substrate-binding protein